MVALRYFALILLAAVIALGVVKAFRDGSNRIEDWLPVGANETRDLHWFRDQFGNDSFLMISWDGCEVNSDPSSKQSTGLSLSPVAEFSRLLRNASKDASSPKYFSRVITGDEAIDLLTRSSIGLSRDQARNRLQGWMIGSDGKTSCILAVLSQEGTQDDRRAVASISQIATRVLGEEFNLNEQLHIAGPALEAIEIEKSSHQFLVPLNLACYSVCILLLLITFRCPRVAAIVLFNAIASQLLLLAVIGFSPWCRLDAILLIAPSFMFVITVSGAIHIVNYYRDQLQYANSSSIVLKTLNAAAAPTLFAAMTTCIGLLSLTLSSLAPVRNFGIYSALGVGLSLMLLATIPWQLAKWKKSRFSSGSLDGVDRATIRSHRLVRLAAKHHASILFLAFLALGIGTWAVSHINAKIRIHDFFLPNSKLNRDYAWLQDKIGPLGPVEIVIKIPHSTGLSILDQLQLTKDIASQLSQVEGIASVATGATFAPPLEVFKPSSIRAVARKTLLSRRIDEVRSNLQDLDFLRILPDESLWRITARTFSNDKVDFGPLCQSVTSRMSQEIASRVPMSNASISFVTTGGVPVLQRAQDLMLRDLINSFLCALLLITGSHIVLFTIWALKDGEFSVESPENSNSRWTARIGRAARILLKQIAAGCLSMVPNVLPVAIVFGVIGALGIEVGIGSMLTASVAMGVSVDDTLHFLTWYRRAITMGEKRQAAVESSLLHCSTAMIQTTAVFVLGLAVFTLSPYLPTARYAGIICSMLSIALVCDLVVVPALLLNKLGFLFDKDN